MKRNLLKQAYVSIEVVIVAAVILTAGLCGLLAFIKNAKGNNNQMLNAIDDVYAELELPIGGTGGGAGGAGGGNGGGSGNDPIPELPLTGDAYAIVTEDKTLYLIRSEETPTVGTLYNESPIARVYADIETTVYDGSGEYPLCPFGYDYKKVIAVDKIQPISTNCWFEQVGCTYFDLRNLDMSKVESMVKMFQFVGSSSEETTILGIEDWDVSNVEDFECAFEGYQYYWTGNVHLDLSGWDTSSAVNMFRMFDCAGYQATSFSLGDLSNWDVSNVTNMCQTFNAAGLNATYWSIGDISSWAVAPWN